MFKRDAFLPSAAMRLATAEHYRCCCSPSPLSIRLYTHSIVVWLGTRTWSDGGQWTDRSVTYYPTTKRPDAAPLRIHIRRRSIRRIGLRLLALPLRPLCRLYIKWCTYIFPNSNQINRVNGHIHKKDTVGASRLYLKG